MHGQDVDYGTWEVVMVGKYTWGGHARRGRNAREEGSMKKKRNSREAFSTAERGAGAPDCAAGDRRRLMGREGCTRSVLGENT